MTGPWVIGVLVCGEVHDGIGGVEHILSAVAVVEVEIRDQDAGQSPVLQSIPCGHGHVVENAEPHTAARQGMMTRRTHQRKAMVCFTVQDGVYQVDQATCGKERDIVGAVVEIGVGIEVPTASLRDVPGKLHVLLLVHCQQVLCRKRGRVNLGDLLQ